MSYRLQIGLGLNLHRWVGSFFEGNAIWPTFGDWAENQDILRFCVPADLTRFNCGVKIERHKAIYRGKSRELKQDYDKILSLESKERMIRPPSSSLHMASSWQCAAHGLISQKGWAGAVPWWSDPRQLVVVHRCHFWHYWVANSTLDRHGQLTRLSVDRHSPILLRARAPLALQPPLEGLEQRPPWTSAWSPLPSLSWASCLRASWLSLRCGWIHFWLRSWILHFMLAPL